MWGFGRRTWHAGKRIWPLVVWLAMGCTRRSVGKKHSGSWQPGISFRVPLYFGRATRRVPSDSQLIPSYTPLQAKQPVMTNRPLRSGPSEERAVCYQFGATVQVVGPWQRPDGDQSFTKSIPLIWQISGMEWKLAEWNGLRTTTNCDEEHHA